MSAAFWIRLSGGCEIEREFRLECGLEFVAADQHEGREDAEGRYLLALWGARSLGPPTAAHELFPGWLENALDAVLAPVAPPGRFEFRVGAEVASIVDGEARPGPIEKPDVVDDPQGIHDMFVDRRQDLVSIVGDHDLLRRLLDAAPTPVPEPVAT